MSVDGQSPGSRGRRRAGGSVEQRIALVLTIAILQPGSLSVAAPPIPKAPAQSSETSVGQPAAPSARGVDARKKGAAPIASLPLHFIENRGQVDSRVAYYVHGSRNNVYLTRDGIYFDLSKPERSTSEGIDRGKVRWASVSGERWMVRLAFEGANPQVKISGRERTSAIVSYFRGQSSQWKTNLPTYGSVLYEELWPGIDLVYDGDAGRPKYTFLVKPGADPRRIRLRYEGATSVRLKEGGRLAVETPVGGFEEEAPYAYQGDGEARTEVRAEFGGEESAAGESYRFGFRVGPYDKTKLLVLDPVVLAYCGYIGGSDVDDAYAVAVDGAGNAYVVGRAVSTQVTFPETVGSLDTTYNGGVADAFVAKIDASGSLVYCGYIGGNLFDIAYDVAVDASGNAYVAGTTASTTGFPVTAGSLDTTFNGAAGTADAFVAKVNATGSALVYCAFIGGSADDEAFGIAIDGLGNAYLGGYTKSAAATFPETVGAFDTSLNGTQDAWAAKVNTTGSALVYCTYLGGSGVEQVNGIAVDGAGNAYLAGRTSSTEAQAFPVVTGPDLTYNGSGLDSFVAKVNTTGAGLVYCGYVGGSGDEELTAVVVDGSNNAYFVGTTNSTEATYPTAVGPDVTQNGGFDAVVAKLDSTGTFFIYSGFVGGTGDENAQDVDINPVSSSSAFAYIAGRTTSTEATFPVAQGPDGTYNGGAHDGYVAMISPAGTSIPYCGYVGGSGDDVIQGLAVDPSGSGTAYIAGGTDSSEAMAFPVAVGPDVAFNGLTDAFVAKLTLVPTAVELLSFEARGGNGAVELQWQTASELHNLGFHLYRASEAGGPYERITTALVPGLGASPTGASYSYVDVGLVNGATYYYSLEDVETTGRTERHGPVSSTPVGSGPGPVGPGTGGSVPPDEPSDGGAGSARITYGDPSGARLRVLERDLRHVVLELLTPGFFAVSGGEGTTRIEIPGFEQTAAAGAPAVPTKHALLEAVAGRSVRVASVSAEDVVSFEAFGLEAAGAAEMVATEGGVLKAGAARRRLLESYRRGGYAPYAWARLRETVFQGETKKASIELAPLRYDASRGRTVLARRLVVRIEFFGREASERSRGGSRGRLAAPRAARTRGVVAQLVARDNGLYRVRFEDVFGRRRGVPVTALRLSRQGQAVAFHVEPPGPMFGPGSSLFFTSEGSRLNPWGDAVYELEAGRAGLQMGVVSATPTGAAVGEYLETRTFEENRYYQAGLLEAPDLWLWDVVVSPATRSYPFTLDEVSGGSTPSRLRVVLQGASDFEELDHHVRLSVNGTAVGEATWDGKAEQVIEAEVGPGLLVEGSNSLAIENVGDAGAAYSMVFLNRFAVSYPRRLTAMGGGLGGSFASSGRAEIAGVAGPGFVVDTTKAPIWVRGSEPTPTGIAIGVEAGRSYLAVSETALSRPEARPAVADRLREPGVSAEWMLIAPREFLEAAQPLVELRVRQGLTAKAVAVEDVFAEFGFGESNPGAIRDFLAYAFHNGRTTPRYVVLLGDSTYDPKNYLSTGVKDRIPSPLVKTSYLWTVSDPTLAAVNGTDLVPDVAIGRLSAGSLHEAQVLVDKLVAFEEGGRGLAGPAVLVADDADAGGRFESDADEIASLLSPQREVRKIYLRELGAGGARAQIRGAFDTGAGIVSYVGHGGTVVWASENIFNSFDVPALQPQAAQPLLLTLDCLNGFFHFPPLDSLAEALVKAEGKGAIAAFSPSGLSLDAPAHVYHQALVKQIESGENRRLGDAVLSAQKAYADSGALPELLSIYHLLGDPGMSLPSAPGRP